METEETKTNERKEPQLAYLALVFLVLIFFVRALYFISRYFERVGMYYGDLTHQGFVLLFLVTALFYVVASIGLLLKRRFGYYLSIVLIAVDILFSFAFYATTEYVLLSLIAVGLSIASIVIIKTSIKPLDKKDKIVLVGIGLVVILYILLLFWFKAQPTTEELQDIVTQEAIEKNDITVCNKLKIGMGNCMQNFAESKKDAKLCELLPSDYNKDLCYLHIADSTNDPKLCELIKNGYDKKMCGDFSKS